MSRSVSHRMGKEPINMSHHTIAVAVVKTSEHLHLLPSNSLLLSICFCFFFADVDVV